MSISFEVFEKDGEPFVIYETDGMLQEPAAFVSDSYDNYIAVLNGTSTEFDSHVYIGNCGKVASMYAKKNIKILYFGKNYDSESMAEYLCKILSNLGFVVEGSSWGRFECVKGLGFKIDTTLSILSRIDDYGVCLIDCYYFSTFNTGILDCIELPIPKCC